jgi:hypothetical protein
MAAMKRHPRLQWELPSWPVPLVGYQVNRCLVDYALTLDLNKDDHDNVSIRLEGEFVFSTEDHRFSLSSEDPTRLGPVFAVLHQTIASATAHSSGRLVVAFVNGDTLVADQHPDYENWEVVGDHGLRIVCLPGGSLAVWEAEEASASDGPATESGQ